MTGRGVRAIRPITLKDAAACANFSCRGHREPWSVAIEEIIREQLVELVVGAWAKGLGLWVSGRLAGVISWTEDLAPPGVFHVGILATTDGYRRKHVATQLKQAVIDRARAAGAALVVSEVHIDNTGMQAVNEHLGAKARRDPTDFEHVIYTIRVG